MRSIALAALLSSACLFASPASAMDGCGVGCHSTVSGSCVVDGWESGAVRWNECPAGAQSRPPCYQFYTWRKHSKLCMRID